MAYASPRREASRAREPVFLPDVQMRSDYAVAHLDDPDAAVWSLFERRLESVNLNLPYFQRVLGAIDAARATRDTHRLATAHALVLLQTQPNSATLMRAERMIYEIREVFGTTAEVTRLIQLLAMMQQNLATNDPDYIVRRVNWSISNACPMICKGCYNPFVAGTIGLADAQRIVNKLAKHGTTSVMFTGGDPLLWEHIGELLAYAKGLGLTTGLDTTGHTSKPVELANIAPNVDSFGLPLDGSTEEIVRKFRRGPRSSIVEQVQAVLSELDGLDAHVRVHTVVHRGNITDLGKVAGVLGEHRSVRQWALYQFWGRRASRRIRDAMDIQTSEFMDAVAALPAGTIEVLPYTAARREMTNFIIQASGQVTTSAGQPGEEFIIGNILTQPMAELVHSPAVSQHLLISNLVGHGYKDQTN